MANDFRVLREWRARIASASGSSVNAHRANHLDMLGR